jgi:hypothetical protein
MKFGNSWQCGFLRRTMGKVEAEREEPLQQRLQAMETGTIEKKRADQLQKQLEARQAEIVSHGNGENHAS